MDPMRRVLIGLSALATIATLAATPAHAQFYDDARRVLDLGPDPLSRSPRMVGMGRLSLVLEDVHNRFDIWEFSRNPAALLEGDSASTFELYPSTASNSTVHDDVVGAATRERQDFALREYRTGYEAWRKAPSGAAFGIIGEFDRLRTDTPESGDSELRTQFTVPRTSLVVAGRMPVLASDRVRYGIAFTHRYEGRSDETRTVISNAAGDYIDKDGVMLPSPQTMVPTNFGIRSVGARFGVLLRAAKWLRLAGSYEFAGNAIEGRDDADRTSSEIREDRPYGTFSASAQGHIGGRLRFVGDASRWATGQTDQRWVASFSTGSGQPPIQGRGLFQRRDESGHELRGRASWTERSLTLSAGGSAFRREVTTRVPPIDDQSSFNYFLNFLSSTPGADSLALPDSVRSNQTTETGNEYGAGAALRLPWRSQHVRAGAVRTRTGAQGVGRAHGCRDADGADGAAAGRLHLPSARRGREPGAGRVRIARRDGGVRLRPARRLVGIRRRVPGALGARRLRRSDTDQVQRAVGVVPGSVGVLRRAARPPSRREDFASSPASTCADNDCNRRGRKSP
jgi:hypothetical protein